jgi:hypothetical protein
MAADDRNQSFEKALAGHLRADATASGSSAHGACADAETLAAYHEGLLAPDQVASTKQHLHTCARCQEILAHLQATDEIPLAAAEAGAQQRIPAASAAKPAVHVFKPRRAFLRRWVAPAGALAAALLVWVAVRDNTPVRMPAQAEVVGKSVPVSSALPSPPSSSDAAGVARAVGAGGPGEARTSAPTPSSNLADQRRSALSAKEKDSVTALQSAPSFTSREQLPDDSLHRYAPAAPRSDPNPKAENGRSAELPARPTEQKQPDEKTDSLYAAAPQPAPPTGAVAGALTSNAAESSAARSKAFAKKAAAPPPPAATGQEQQIGGMSRFNENAEMRLANSISDVTISAPGGAVSWRIGSAGIIEYSSDSGKTWTLQPSGTITDLLAGSAPSGKICWIVGRAGTILRTTDGGAHWQKIRSPAQEDIRSIIAEDARRATISVTNGAYQTLDAGATWNKLAPE